MQNLFICHTLYHVLIALLRTLRGKPSFLVLSMAVPGAANLAETLRATGHFAGVQVVDEAALDRQNAESSIYRVLHTGKPSCFALPRKKQDLRVYISNDWSALGRFLQHEHIPYILCEDTLGGTLDPDQHLLVEQRAASDFAARRRGSGYFYWGDSRFCVAVESEDAFKCRIFPEKKLITYSKAALLASLTEAEKAAVLAVFVPKPLPGDAAVYARATLLLPRSLVEDRLADQATQNRIFRAVAAKYADGPLFIKTHPRDATDYEALFPTATVLPRFMPSEVLNFCLPHKFRRAVTVQSWVLRGFTGAQENIFLTLDEAKELLA